MIETHQQFNADLSASCSCGVVFSARQGCVDELTVLIQQHLKFAHPEYIYKEEK